MSGNMIPETIVSC